MRSQHELERADRGKAQAATIQPITDSEPPGSVVERMAELVADSLSCLLALFLACCTPPTGLQWFVRQSPSYYLQMAQECDKLTAQASTDLASPRRMAGNDPSLPQVVRDLHPNYVQVGTNGVGLRIGVGRGAYWVGWSSNPMDQTLWELEASAEGSRKTVFSLRKYSVPSRSGASEPGQPRNQR